MPRHLGSRQRTRRTRVRVSEPPRARYRKRSLRDRAVSHERSRRASRTHRRVWSWTIQTGWLKDRVRVSHARRAPFRAATWATRSNPVDVSTARLPLPAVPEGTAGRAIERLPALSRLVTKLSCHRCTWYVIMPHAHCFSRTSLRHGSSRAARNVGASCVPESQDALRRQHGRELRHVRSLVSRR